MLSVVKLLIKGEVGVCALNSHGNYIVDHGKSWKNHGIVILNFCGNTEGGNIVDHCHAFSAESMLFQSHSITEKSVMTSMKNQC